VPGGAGGFAGRWPLCLGVLRRLAPGDTSPPPGGLEVVAPCGTCPPLGDLAAVSPSCWIFFRRDLQGFY